MKKIFPCLLISLLICASLFFITFSVSLFSQEQEEDERINIDEMSKKFQADDELYIQEELEYFRDRDKAIINNINFSGGNIIITPSQKKGFSHGGTFWYETVFHSPKFEIKENPEDYEINLEQRRSRVYLFASNQRRPIWKYNIPSDIDTVLNLSLSGSNTLVELGGTRLKSANISAKGQETAIMFSKPVRRVAEEIVISVDVGKMSVLDVLNSNTAYMKLSFRSGSYFLDFSGKADRLTERTVDIGLNFAKLDIVLSEDVGYEIFTSTLIHISAPDLIRNEDYHRTTNFNDAKRKIYISIRGVAGKVNII